ncbi:M20/M25/M40 family metallo-hydrolase [Actinomadura atramentaria]|uniref:M20/M25/M40 family metallo-hydrolase n=1 Tax=Actinomadura atramentaria TaxID=1990 RepID=UPI000524799E|nr:M20/M25/M40 family metallo-hydrolase [Actinomadura atramentaria]
MKISVGAAVLVLPFLVVPDASASSASSPSAFGEVRRHLRAFATIAREHGGNRAAGRPGYDASVAYVVDELRRAGYRPVVRRFTYPHWADRITPELAVVAPKPRPYVHATDFVSMEYAGTGDVTARAVAVDVPKANEAGTAGCEDADFASFPRGAVALLQRGACDFGAKAARARAAGAAAVLIYNRPDQRDLVRGTLGKQQPLPVVSTSYTVGAALVKEAAGGKLVLHVRTDAGTSSKAGANVLADTRTGRASRTVVVGAHLDSVPEGPGINDNGTGSATVLAVASRLAHTRVRNRVRFAFWGSEEDGLQGSEAYVKSLTKAEKKRIALALNFDMLGSVNGIRGIYDGDGSQGTATAPPAGSAAIERTFRAYYAARGLPTSESPFNGRSDYGPFVKAGIPAGGMESGAEGVKTLAEAKRYGGKAGDPYDPCYHVVCDTEKNVDYKLLKTMVAGVEHAVRHFAVRSVRR